MPADLTVYLNGRLLPVSEAHLSVEDRGTLFADGVYEVIRYYAGRPFALEPHVARLRRSLDAVRIPPPADFDALADVTAELLRCNQLSDAKVYWQITRGAAPRDYAIPPGLAPTVLVIAYPAEPVTLQAPPAALRAILLPDERWAHCWIKSLMLLGNMLAANAARDAGADIPILHREGRITEGSSANFFGVRNGVLLTHPADRWILPGVTRAVVLELAGELGLTMHERAVAVDDLPKLDEAFVTGTTTHIAAITQVNGRPVGRGDVGPVTRQLHQALFQRITSTCLVDVRSESSRSHR